MENIFGMWLTANRGSLEEDGMENQRLRSCTRCTRECIMSVHCIADGLCKAATCQSRSPSVPERSTHHSALFIRSHLSTAVRLPGPKGTCTVEPVYSGQWKAATCLQQSGSPGPKGTCTVEPAYSGQCKAATCLQQSGSPGPKGTCTVEPV